MRYAWTGRAVLGTVLTKEEMLQSLRDYTAAHPENVEDVPDLTKDAAIGDFALPGEDGQSCIPVIQVHGNVTEGCTLKPAAFGAGQKAFSDRETCYIIPADRQADALFDENGNAVPFYRNLEELLSEMRYKTETLCCPDISLENRTGTLYFAQVAPR